MTKPGNPWVAAALLRLAKFQMAEGHGERFLQLVKEAKSRIVEISAEEVEVLVKRGARIIDVRQREEFQRGYIPGAINLPKGTIELEIERQEPDSHAEIITYCARGNRSAIVADNLQRMGYTRVRSVAGGFSAWLEAGFPAVTKSLLVED